MSIDNSVCLEPKKKYVGCVLVSSSRIKYVKILNGSSRYLVGQLLVNIVGVSTDVIMHNYQIVRGVGYDLVEIQAALLVQNEVCFI